MRCSAVTDFPERPSRGRGLRGESQQAGSVTEFVTDSSTTLHRGAAESASVRLSHVALHAVACFTGDHHFKPGHDVGEVSPEPMVHEEAH